MTQKRKADKRRISKSVSRVLTRERLRARVLSELAVAGFVVGDDDLLSLPVTDDAKETARHLHAGHRRSVIERNTRFIERWEDRLLPRFASGDEIDPVNIQPVIVPVRSDDQEAAALFRFASLHWSIPVSQGYGRRTRFLILDQANEKLIGIYALGDPVFNLGVRDQLIGWDQEQRQKRLYNVFDAFVLGAVEPYRQLLGGKLAALCSVANETAEFLAAKYTGTETEILKQRKDATPVLITTSSALGRSSIYNRLRMNDRWIFRSIGFTQGFGHFHFSDALFDDLVALVGSNGGTLRGNRYGHGPNWRIRTLRRGLQEVGLRGELLRHGIKREVFVAPRGLGWRAYLRGESDHVWWHDYAVDHLGAFWRDRWAVPRAERRPDFLAHKREMMRLSHMLEPGYRWSTPHVDERAA